MFNYLGTSYKFFPTVGIKLTGCCRFQCPFCCEPDKDQKVYPIGDFQKIINILHSAGTQRLCLTGGDPLLYPEIEKIIFHSKSLGIKTILLTADGELLKQNIQKVKDVDAVRLSLHEIGIGNDDIVNHKGAFAALVEAASALREVNIPIQVTTVVTPQNKDKLKSIAEWCIQNQVEKYYLFGLMKSGKGCKFISGTGSLTISELEEVHSVLLGQYNDRLDIKLYKYESYAECILVYGDGRIVIDPYPDKDTHQKEIGNLFTNTIDEIVSIFSQDKYNCSCYKEHLKQV